MNKPNEITIKEAVKLTGYSRQQLYNVVSDGKVKSRKPGRWEILIDRASLLAYAEKHSKLVPVK